MNKKLVACFVAGIVVGSFLTGCTGTTAPPTQAIAPSRPAQETATSPAPGTTAPGLPAGRAYDSLPVWDGPGIYSAAAAHGTWDDVVAVPNLGSEYRGNLMLDGQDYFGERVPVVEIDVDGIFLEYRGQVSAAPGRTKYNIIKVIPGESVVDCRLYADNVPAWLGLLEAPSYVSDGTAYVRVVVMRIGEGAPAGKAVFSLGVEVNGHDLGLFPVELEITGN